MFKTVSSNAQIDDLLIRVCEELQITPSQHEQAESRYNSVSEWLGAEDSPLAQYKPAIAAQGSLRIGTTVKPIGHNEFDLDLVCLLQADWEQITHPVALLDMVENRLKAPGSRYKDLVERKNRCIRLNYANEFHMDILPACPHLTAGPGCVMVPDRAAQEWKPSNPTGYAKWFEGKTATLREVAVKAAEPLPEQETVDEKKPLKLAVQLIKRWRDIYYQPTLKTTPISIVLTTLAAEVYGGQTSIKDAMTGILDGIVAIIPPTGRLVVLNPTTTDPKENFSERWDADPEGYAAFVAGIKSFKRQWDELGRRQGIHNIGPVLESLFGEKIYRIALANQAKATRKSHEGGKMGIQRGSGAVGVLGGIHSQAIPRNTFYGS